jgi:hypothetical protein
VDIDPADARLFLRHIELSGSSSREERLAAHEPTGELRSGFDRISSLIRAGGPDAADAAVLLAAAATTPEQLAYVVAGPFEDLWYADARTFEGDVLPRLSDAVLAAAIDGMDIPAEALGRLKAYLASRD